MSSGPAALTGARARELRAMLAALGFSADGKPDKAALGRDRGALAGPPGAAGPRGRSPRPHRRVPGPAVQGNDPDGLVLMAAHMLAAPDRTAELARLDQLPMLVIYGENDNAWSPAAQENRPGGSAPPAVHPRGRALPRRRGARHDGQRADAVLGWGRGRIPRPPSPEPAEVPAQPRPGQPPRAPAK